jgi:glycosyltransferase involved in cell wall biosynthesis
MRTFFYPGYVKKHLLSSDKLTDRLADIKRNIQALCQATPDVSIVIPAYNEEKYILRTLSSLSQIKSKKSIEIIVVDNNSTDATAELVKATGVVYVFEKQQGVKHARNAGLQKARGSYLINADADTIYAPNWVDVMTDPLENKQIAEVYTWYSFYSDRNVMRVVYFLYEIMGDILRWKRKYFGEEAVNVFGCSSAFRKEEALKVNGFEHPPGANEDGYLGLKLRDQLGKRLYLQKKAFSMVWTSDRRLYDDGSLWKAASKRFRKELKK